MPCRHRIYKYIQTTSKDRKDSKQVSWQQTMHIPNIIYSRNLPWLFLFSFDLKHSLVVPYSAIFSFTEFCLVLTIK